jgi:hypothetical protein
VTLRPYRRERLVLVLAALATLPILNGGMQDVTRLALTDALTRGSVQIDRYHRIAGDRAYYKGHWYTDKAPGVSIAALVPVEGLRLVDFVAGSRQDVPVWRRASHLWTIRMWTSGVPFIVLCFLVGRVAEGLVHRTGAATVVTFGVGTMVGSLAATVFAHVATATALFGAFVLATRTPRDEASSLPRSAAAGLLAGAAVLFEYQAGVAAAILGAYVAWRGGRRALAGFVAGALPPILTLGAYDWAAFDSPFRLSYRYIANDYAEQQHAGFFGIGMPTVRGAWFVFLDGHGLLLVSPVLALAACGLALFARRHRAEGLTAAAIVTFFVVYTMGYFLPNGGTSPGPRFTTAALPFLALGLPYAFTRWRWPTIALAALSVAVSMFNEVTWGVANTLRVDVWPHTLWSRGGLPVRAGVLLLLAAAAAAGIVALLELLRRPAPQATH